MTGRRILNFLRRLGLGEATSGEPSNQGKNLSEKGTTTTPGQPPRRELGDGSGLSEAELMEGELSPVWSRLCRLRELFGGLIIETAEEYLKLPDIEDSHRQPLKKELEDLRSFLGTVSTNTEGAKGTEGLEIMIKIAFEYIKRFERNDDRSRQLAILVVEIARELKEAVDKIAYKRKFSYETKADFLNGLISLMVELILNVDPEFRGRKPGEYINHPNKALLTTLDRAAYVLLDEAATKAKESNDRKELIGAISSLLEMTKELLLDELEEIYGEIRTKISTMMKNGNIDDNLRKQFDEIINQDINDNSIEQLRRIFHQLVDQYR